jgi:hypothetical protein
MIPDLSARPDVRAAPAPARATYAEDDWIALVEVLEDLSTREREAYRLRVVRTLQPSAWLRPVADGTRFHCDQPRNQAGLIFTLTRNEP